MLKKQAMGLLTILLALVICISSSGSFTVFADEKEIEAIDFDTEKVEYALPFPGILPDHPFYVVKTTRDSIMIFLTRDHLKKADLYLLLSDKYASMAVSLSEQGEWKTSAETMLQAEHFASEMIDTLKTSTEQGVSASGDFLDEAILSNEKHMEIIQKLLMDSTDGSRGVLQEAMEVNESNSKDLQRLRK